MERLRVRAEYCVIAMFPPSDDENWRRMLDWCNDKPCSISVKQGKSGQPTRRIFRFYIEQDAKHFLALFKYLGENIWNGVR